MARGLVGGVVLVAWIVVQLLVIQQFFFLQPVIIAVCVTEAWPADRS